MFRQSINFEQWLKSLKHQPNEVRGTNKQYVEDVLNEV